MFGGTVKKEDISEDEAIAEDLSPKHKTVSVQTEKCQHDKFAQLFVGFSQKQIQSLMNRLIEFLLKNDPCNVLGSESGTEDISKKIKSPTCTPTGWIPLEPEISPSSSFQYSPNQLAFHSYNQYPQHSRINPAQSTLVTTNSVTNQTCSEEEDILKNQKIYPENILREQQKILKDRNTSLRNEILASDRHRARQLDIPPNVQLESRKTTEEEESETESIYHGHLSRDERLVVDIKIPFTVEEIIHKPMEEFNDLVSSQAVTEEQMNICRDIRRRGKNKIAAQNCRKRKIDQISCLEKDLDQARHQKEKILSERVSLLCQQQEWSRRLGGLEREILNKLGKNKKEWMIIVDRNMLVQVEKNKSIVIV